MQNNTGKRALIKRILGIATSVIAVITGIAFMYACMSIYLSGDNPFTRESVGAWLLRLLPPVILFAFAILAGFVLDFALPTEGEKLRGSIDPELTLGRLSGTRTPDGDAISLIKRERRLRHILRAVNLALLAAGAVAAFVYSVIPGNYTPELNASVLALALVVGASFLPALVLAGVRCFVESRSYAREIETMKSAPRSSERAEEAVANNGAFGGVRRFFENNKKPVLLGVRIAIIIAAVVYITLGILNGGMNDVLQKAIKICTECIGLG